MAILGLLVIGATTAAPKGEIAPGPAADPSDVLRATLPNGLRVIIVRNRLAPVVATAVNYLVGSDETPSGFPGTAHAQEHMMFRGVPGLSADQLADIGSVMGGNFNANTRESLTQYLYTVPAEDLNIALHIEALRMRGVDDAQEAWDKERGAIEQEVAQDLSSPFYKAYQQLRAAFFSGSVYAHDALGTKESFDRTTAAALKSFHDAWYTPNNAILVIVGNVDPRNTLVQVRELFASIPSHKLPPRPALTLGPIEATRIDIPTDRPTATALIALRLPGLDSPDYPALEILSDILNNQRFALYGLVAEGKAVETGFSYDALPRAGIAYAAASFAATSDERDIEGRMRAILERVREHGISEDLLRAAKLQEARQTEFQKTSIAGLASAWSDAVSLYGLPSPDADLARLQKVTLADVNRVAKKYLGIDHAIVMTLSPQTSGRPVTSAAGFGGQESIALGEAKGGPLPDWAKGLITHLRPSVSPLRPSVETLPNGLTVIVQPTAVSDTVSIYGHIRNRAEVEEPSRKEGVALVLDQLFPFGTEKHDRVAFQEALDAIGADESAGADFNIKVLTRNFPAAAALLAEHELHPALPQEAFDNLKGQLAAYVAARNRSPSYLGQRALRAGLYPPDDPLLRQATDATIRGLTRNDIVEYYKQTYRPDLTTIVVIGNVSVQRAMAIIRQTFGAWHATGRPPKIDPSPVPPNAAAAVAVPDTSRVQDIVTVAQTLAMPRSHPDYYALALGNAVLGGGFYATRLSIDLRKNAGLVYSVNSDLQPGRARSAFLVRYACDPVNVARAYEAVAKEIRNMQETPISTAELLKAKALLVRQIPLNESGVEDIAHEMLLNADLGLPIDENQRAAERYIALDPMGVQAAFRRWMRPEGLVRASQGPVP
ncbi:MAG TPA: pitrilysin family protein [Rhizomicrobium sp.]|nr:pitrilysin family protein [Rhizomicrobium sp.]